MALKFYTGFESTPVYGSGTDVLENTRHIERMEYDLGLVNASGMKLLRYPIPWHRIERTKGELDWSFADRAVERLDLLGLTPILDPMHHISFPAWLNDGFANPDFPELYVGFLKQIAARYPHLNQYTLFNEPTATAVLCGLTGDWYPHYQADECLVPILTYICRAICLAYEELKSRVSDFYFFHVDTAEHHEPVDGPSQDTARLFNHRRFLAEDLILGLVDSLHPLYHWLLEHGMRREDLGWFRQHPVRIDMRGLDYYPHSDLQWKHLKDNPHCMIFPSCSPVGFAEIAREYVSRYGYPISLAETNIRGHITDRVSWLKYMLEECEALVRDNIPVHGFCWFPFIDSTDWNSLLTKCDLCIDPQGIYMLGEDRFERIPSELSQIYASLAQGHISSRDIPAYPFRWPWDESLTGYLRFMENWDWVGGVSFERKRA